MGPIRSDQVQDQLCMTKLLGDLLKLAINIDTDETQTGTEGPCPCVTQQRAAPCPNETSN